MKLDQDILNKQYVKTRIRYHLFQIQNASSIHGFIRGAPTARNLF